MSAQPQPAHLCAAYDAMVVERREASLVCIRRCLVWESCKSDPLTCPLRSDLAAGQPEPVRLMRLPRQPKRRSWLDVHKDDVAIYLFVAVALGYFTWGVLAAVAEGRLPVPFIR